MRIAFLIIVVLHGLIHLLGFVKGVGLKEVKELTLPISKNMGFVWLEATMLLLAFAIVHALNSKYSWVIGILAVVISQILVFMFWKDAKFGTIPNMLILLVSLISYGHYNFQRLIQKETANLLSSQQVLEIRAIEENDLARLPKPVGSWLRNSGAVGKPYTRFGKVTQVAEMQMKPGDERWLPAKAIQYTGIHTPSFLWTVDVKMNPFISFQGRDKFENGKGEMLIKMHALANIVNESGGKMDEGTLQRYLGEMVWFPSLALSEFVEWEQLDEHVAKATMTYQGTRGSGTFYFNPRGEVTKFSALRFKGNEADAKRFEWEMNISGYDTFEGIKVPATMTSTWKLADQDWTWLKLQVTSIEYH
jgi:hypothetical protein